LRHRWSRRVVPVLVCCFLLTAAAVAAWADRKPRDPAALTTVEALEALIGDSERNALDLDRISAELRAEGPVRGRAQETMRATGIETERLRGNPELARYRQALADVRAGRPLRPEMEAGVAALRASRAVTAYQREVARRTRLASIGRLLGADHDEIGRAVAAARRDARRRIAEARAILADVRKQWPDPANRPPEHNHLAEAAAEQLRGAQAELDVLPGLESEGKAAIARRLAKARKAAGPSGVTSRPCGSGWSPPSPRRTGWSAARSATSAHVSRASWRPPAASGTATTGTSSPSRCASRSSNWSWRRS
jgi:hypothetical protein